MKSVCILTLGCRVNQYDSQVLRELASRSGFSVTDDQRACDAVVLNSCAVTAAADTDARRLLRRAKRLNPRARTALVGCFPMGSGHPRADLVLKSPEKFRLFERLMGRGSSRMEEAHWPVPIASFAGRRRPILKVQDGCRYRCSFCIVPRLRGGSVSRPVPQVLEEARSLAGAGARELVLAGIELSSWGLDLGYRVSQPRLVRLVEALLKVPGVERVRLSSYGVAGFEEGLLGLMGQDRGLCPFLHLPLQSGDEGVLRAMRRPYTLQKFREAVGKARRLVPGIGLTTDVIAGFPGETGSAFLSTLERLTEFGFQDIHPFPYSQRPGTAAERITPKIPPPILRKRMERLLAFKRQVCQRTAARLAGWTVRVIAENHSYAWFAGTTPEGVRIIFPRKGRSLGQMVDARVTGFRKGQILAVPVK